MPWFGFDVGGGDGLVLLVKVAQCCWWRLGVTDLVWSIFINCILIGGIFGIVSGGGVIIGCCRSSLTHHHNHH